MKERTINYIFTANPKDPNDLNKIQALRKVVKGTKLRVNCKGRGYKDDATKKHYSTLRAGNYRNVNIWLNDAARWDVYIHGWDSYDQLPTNVFMEICRLRRK